MKTVKGKKPRSAAMPFAPDVEEYEVALTAEALKRSFVEKLFYSQGKHPHTATPNDLYTALALAVRERVVHRGLQCMDTYLQRDVKHVCYFSAEFLMGPQLGNMLVNLGIQDMAREAVGSFGLKLEDLLEQEEDWRRVTSIPWRRWKFRRSVMAFGMSTGFSIRESRTAGRWKSPIAGSGWAIPGRCIVRSCITR